VKNQQTHRLAVIYLATRVITLQHTSHFDLIFKLSKTFVHTCRTGIDFIGVTKSKEHPRSYAPKLSDMTLL